MSKTKWGEEVNPCRRCKAAPYVRYSDFVGGWVVGCDECEQEYGSSMFRKDAIDAWNEENPIKKKRKEKARGKGDTGNTTQS